MIWLSYLSSLQSISLNYFREVWDRESSLQPSPPNLRRQALAVPAQDLLHQDLNLPILPKIPTTVTISYIYLPYIVLVKFEGKLYSFFLTSLPNLQFVNLNKKNE